MISFLQFYVFNFINAREAPKTLNNEMRLTTAVFYDLIGSSNRKLCKRQ